MQNIEIQTVLKGAMNDAIARTVSIGGLAAIALIHMLQLPEAFAAIGYLGGLFVGAVAASLALAAALTRTSDDRVWGAAGGLAALILLCYVLSRSVGLPEFTDDVGEWSEPLGLASMVAETLLVFVTAAVLTARRQAGAPAPAPRTEAAAAREAEIRPAIG